MDLKKRTMNWTTNKIREIKKYLKEDSSDPAKDLLWIVWTFLNIPMILIHELCHLIAIILTRTHADIDPKRWHFMERIEVPYINQGESSKQAGLSWAFPVALIDNPPWKVFIVGIAPVIGTFFILFLNFYIPLHLHIDPHSKFFLWELMMFWFAISVKTHSWLSKDDKECVKIGWNWIYKKISPILLKIKKLFVHL